MNNNTQIETVEEEVIKLEDAANKYVEAKEDRCRAYGMVYAAFVNGANWQKQQDEAKYKELLDSHNDLLELLKNSRPLMQPREYCKGDDYLILDGRIENAINKAKNIKQ